jgi:hypothetical protein
MDVDFEHVRGERRGPYELRAVLGASVVASASVTLLLWALLLPWKDPRTARRTGWRTAWAVIIAVLLFATVVITRFFCLR